MFKYKEFTTNWHNHVYILTTKQQECSKEHKWCQLMNANTCVMDSQTRHGHPIVSARLCRWHKNREDTVQMLTWYFHWVHNYIETELPTRNLLLPQSTLDVFARTSGKKILKKIGFTENSIRVQNWLNHLWRKDEQPQYHNGPLWPRPFVTFKFQS